jgi:hypothetical protein
VNWSELALILVEHLGSLPLLLDSGKKAQMQISCIMLKWLALDWRYNRLYQLRTAASFTTANRLSTPLIGTNRERAEEKKRTVF